VAPIKNDDQLLAFSTEIAILKECPHDNVTNFIGAYYNKSEGNLWIIIEHCAGGSVNDILMKRRVRLRVCVLWRSRLG
jgi:serine/threonine protein kinase